jgi:hypothetical protein
VASLGVTDPFFLSGGIVKLLPLPRRDAITFAAASFAAAATPSQALAQQATVSLADFPPRSSGRLHGRRIREVREQLKGNAPASRDGLMLLVEVLVAAKVLTKEDSELLKKIIRILFELPGLQQIIPEVQRIFDGLGAQADALLVTLVDLIRDSLATARQLLDGIDWKVVLSAIAADMAGALTGAGTGAQVGGKTGAILGAVFGGASASINSVLAVRK